MAIAKQRSQPWRNNQPVAFLLAWVAFPKSGGVEQTTWGALYRRRPHSDTTRALEEIQQETKGNRESR